MNQKLITKILTELPEKESLNGTIMARYARLDLGSIVILTDHPTNSGPATIWGIDYYAPAAAQRLGLVPEYCRFFVHTPMPSYTPEEAARINEKPVFDDTYEQVNIGKLIYDDYDRLHAGSFSIPEPNLTNARLLERYLGMPLSKHIGRKGVFYTPEAETLQLTITAYDGKNYYTRGKKGQHMEIIGQLVGFEE